MQRSPGSQSNQSTPEDPEAIVGYVLDELVEVRAEITAVWRSKLGRVRANSSTDLLLGDLMTGAPIVTVESASKLIGRSKARTTDAVNALAEPGVLRQRNVGRQRYRVFEATEVLDPFTGLERALASPTGNTRSDRPVRRVPQRPKQS